MRKIVVVGGGSAGTMSAYTLKKLFPEKQIVLLESDTIAPIGVGESTLGDFNQWLALVGLQDKEWMKECNASYKMSVRFEDFYQNGDGGFHYPFGRPFSEDLNDWYFKKMMYPSIHNSNYAESHYPIMSLVNQNKILSDKLNEDIRLPSYSFKRDVAYHIDATLFAKFLKKKFESIGGECITGTVHKVMMSSEAIINVFTEKDSIGADLFIDCTGFKSTLIGEKLKEPFDSYADILPNNSAWVTQIPYTDKERQMLSYTNCQALTAGWAWKISLWNRMGCGYVYSDNHLKDEKALDEFKNYIATFANPQDLKFKNLKTKVGLRSRVFVKNVVAIGLSAGFIEPLESNGLISVHTFLINLVRLLKRKRISNYVKQQFNFACSKFFRKFAEFVASHFALSERMDSPYWRDVQNRHYHFEDKAGQVNSLFQENNFWVFDHFEYPPAGGMHCIAAGMNFHPTDENTIKYYGCHNNIQHFLRDKQEQVLRVIERKDKWDNQVKQVPTLYQYLKDNIYKDV